MQQHIALGIVERCVAELRQLRQVSPQLAHKFVYVFVRAIPRQIDLHRLIVYLITRALVVQPMRNRQASLLRPGIAKQLSQKTGGRRFRLFALQGAIKRQQRMLHLPFARRAIGRGERGIHIHAVVPGRIGGFLGGRQSRIHCADFIAHASLQFAARRTNNFTPLFNLCRTTRSL